MLYTQTTKVTNPQECPYGSGISTGQTGVPPNRCSSWAILSAMLWIIALPLSAGPTINFNLLCTNTSLQKWLVLSHKVLCIFFAMVNLVRIVRPTIFGCRSVSLFITCVCLLKWVMPSKWSFLWGHDTNHNAKETVLPDFHTKKNYWFHQSLKIHTSAQGWCSLSLYQLIFQEAAWIWNPRSADDLSRNWRETMARTN